MKSDEIYGNPNSFYEALANVGNEANAPEETQEEVQAEVQEHEQLEEPIIEESNTQEEEHDEEQKQSIRIPKERLDQEIEKRRASENEAQLLKERLSKLEGYIEALGRNSRDSAESSYNDSNNEGLDESEVIDTKLYEYTKKLEQKINQLEQSTMATQKSMTMTQIENEYRKAVPDYDEATRHLLSVELESAKYAFDDQNQAAMFVQQKVQRMVQNAIARGENPAAVAYNLAQKYGYTPANAKNKEVSRAPNLSAIEKNIKRSSTVAAGGAPVVPKQSTDFSSTIQGGKFNIDAFYAALKEASGS